MPYGKWGWCAAVLCLACSDATGSTSRSVVVRFALAGATGAQAVSPASADVAAEGPLVLSGSNGTLTISEVAMIVSRLELERSDDACEREGDHEMEGESECDEFGMPPSFVRLPLPSGVVTVATDQVPEGTWTRLNLRIRNLDLDDDDDEPGDEDHAAEGAGLQALMAGIRTDFPDWPDKASLAVRGTFQAAGSDTPTDFLAYIDAEIKVKLHLDPPLEMTADGPSREITVELDPARWFSPPGGTVRDLSQFNFAQTHRVLDLRLLLLDGFVRAHCDR